MASVMMPPKQVILDRSFAVLGFLPHRGDAIFKSTNLDAGFSPPTYTYTFSKADNNQKTVGFTAMLSAHPTDLEHKRGEHYRNKKEKSYDSRNYSYTANRDSPNGKPQAQSPLFFRFAFGINFFPSDPKRNPAQPPRASCVSRNQIFIWVQDHTLRSKSILPDIRISDAKPPKDFIKMEQFSSGLLQRFQRNSKPYLKRPRRGLLCKRFEQRQEKY
ncbi:hypothetical protein C8R44DRAFT_728877 [Mycena epipterygia]|nr:hypothetical protein C8R44DRAFT_728877 [Mycena epipterygia]